MTPSPSEQELLFRTFLAEARETLDATESALLALEARPADAELLHTIFRHAHTLKGAASLVGVDVVAQLAHAMEDLLARVRDGSVPGSPEVVTLLLATVDALRGDVAAAAAGGQEPSAEHEALALRLRATATSPVPLEGRDDVAATGEAPHPADRAGRTLRVDIGKLDRLLDLAGETAIARGRLAQLLEQLPAEWRRDLLEAHRSTDRLQLELQELAMRVRMVPLGPSFRQHARTVRDLARAHGKDVRFVTEGEDVEADTAIIEGLRDPLTHLIRNAVDHGIESPDLRAALGKDPVGRIALSAAHEGGMIVIRLRDDGAGFDRERIASVARDRGLLPDGPPPADGDLFRLVFEPGFSTAATVTDLSGRGVGMDVARRSVDALRGTIDIASRPGEGAMVTIRLPLTVAIIDGFGIGVGPETYVLPLDAVVKCADLAVQGGRMGGSSAVATIDARPLPVLRLRQLFGIPGEAPKQHLVVVRSGGTEVGLAVDALHGETQAVIKSLGKVFHGLPGISGSTILGDGRVALILDVPALLAEAVGMGAVVH